MIKLSLPDVKGQVRQIRLHHLKCPTAVAPRKVRKCRFAFNTRQLQARHPRAQTQDCGPHAASQFKYTGLRLCTNRCGQQDRVNTGTVPVPGLIEVETPAKKGVPRQVIV